MSQRVAIVLDNLGTFHETPDEERDKILDDLRDEGLDPELVFYGHGPGQLPDTQIDLLVVDFGALWQTPTEDWTSFVIRWADDHPGSLVMLWSGMTADAVGNAMSERAYTYGESMAKWAAWPDNVRALHSGASWDIDWKEADDDGGVGWYGRSLSKLQVWFGVDPAETPKMREIREAGALVAPEEV